MYIPRFVRRYTTRSVIVFDIGSGSVAAAVVHINEHEEARVVAAKRSVLSLEERTEEQTIAALERAMREAGTTVIERYRTSEAASQAGPIKHVHIVVHTPWIGSKTGEARAHLQKPARISSRMIRETGQKALEDIGDPDADTVFESSIIYTALNGYRTGSPVGHTAEDIQVKVLQSTITPAVRKFAESVVGELLPGRGITIRSATLMFTKVLAVIAEHMTYYTLLDVTSDATFCIDARHHSIMQCQTAPLGTRTIIGEITKQQETTPEDVLTNLRLLANNECETTACQKMRDQLANLEPTLTKQFGEMFSRIAENKRLPNQLIIAAHPDIAPWFARFFERLDFSQFTMTGRPFTVTRLLGHHISRIVQADEGVPLDAGIATAAAFVHKSNTEAFENDV